MKILFIIYNLFIYLIALPIKYVLSFFLPKLAEREKYTTDSISTIETFQLIDSKIKIWFHAASMGEFEQAKPIIEFLKRTNPDLFIIASLFSPSGYNTQKNYEYADSIVYMPFDTIYNAKNFISKLKPNLAVFIRYELWLNHLFVLNNNKIPALLINATAPSKSIWNKALFVYYKYAFSLFTNIFTVGSKHTDYFNNIGVMTSIETLSDTRFTRILEKVWQSANEKIIPIDIFYGDDIILVAGSTWSKDEEIIANAVERINQNSPIKITVIYVPHEPTKKHISKLINKLGDAILLSDLLISISQNNQKKIPRGGKIITDSIGKLLKLYGNAHIAYIGGGFGAGAHSLSEAAGYSLPLVCGPNCFNSPDTVYLYNSKALQIVSNDIELEAFLLQLISSYELRKNIGTFAGDYIKQNANSTEVISTYIINLIK